ncbi:MAG: CobW family GTP-binding protein [Hyphomicrobiaceae bacterium]
MSANANASTTIPLTVLTGFLGSGKTTLLKRLINDPAMAGTAVIINEFGEVGIDDALMEKVDDDAVLLPSGCVCCAVRGDLVEALVKMHTKALWGDIPPMKRVVLETTGLADPTPIVHTLMTEERVYRIYQLDAVVTTVDGQHGLAQLDEQFEPAKQIAIADRIIVTKSDIAQEANVRRLEGRLRALNRSAKIMRAVKGDVSPSELIGLGAHEPAITGADPTQWLAAESFATAPATHAHKHGPDCAPDCGHDHGHDYHGHTHTQGDACADPACDHADHHHGHLHGISSFCLTFDTPVEGPEMSNALTLLAQLYGPKLLRVKGILNVKDQPRPFVVHGVQHIFYPPDTLAAWPSADQRSRLVFITKELPEATVRRHFKPFVGLPV